jgi:PAS domain S-box-containing protein
VVDDRSFRVIFEKANCGIAYGDRSGMLLLCNDYFANMIGYTRAQVQSMNFAEFTHPDDVEIELPLFEEIASQKRDSYRIQKRYICKSGRIIWVDLATSVVRDENGEPINYLGVVIDITKEKILEKEIVEKEQRFRDVSESSGEYIWETDRDGRYIFITKPFEDMLGYTLEESLGKTPFDFMPEDEQKRVGEIFGGLASRGETFRGLVHRSLKKDGSTVWQKVNGLPMFDEEGAVKGYRGVARDITDEKRAQDELEAAKLKAEGANRAKTEFLANMSHEIRTPMNAIIGLGGILEDMLENPTQKDILYKINSSSKMLLGVINDILDFSKIEAGKLELEESKFHIEDVLSQLKVMFEEKATSKGLELYFYPKIDGVGLLLGDELRLTQVLTNLLSNAIKFTHSGNVILLIELLNQSSYKDVTIRFSVEDSGIGMDEVQLTKLFQPFSQADTSTTRKYGGTGLGLAISKNIINAMGSHIEVESKKGVGTKFSFTLEFEQIACEVVTSRDEKSKVLIVDDQDISRDVLKTMLSHFEFAYDEASSGLEALELIREADMSGTPYDMLLIDWNMPELNGVDTLERLENMYKSGEIKKEVASVFMISGYSRSDIELEKVKIDSFISKPITPSALFDAIINTKRGIKRAEVGFVDKEIAHNLEGLQLLVAEDNEVNQEVISLLLQRVGISFDIANNGLEAYKKYIKAKDRYDLILMDLQMPIMSGYEATVKIREHDKKIPIVALTAAAMAEDRERVLNSGMNEHLGKPIDRDGLYRVIAQMCGRSVGVAGTKKSSNDTLDREYIEDMIGEKQSVPLLLKLKSQLKEGEFKDIEKAIYEDAQDAPKLVHSLKGVAGNLGAFKLSNLLSSIDARYKSNRKIEDSDIKKLIKARDELLEELEKIDGSLASDEERLSKDEVKNLFMEIKKHLEEGEFVAQELIDRLYQNLQPLTLKDELDRWKNLVEEFEFDSALEIMKKWEGQV